MLKKTKDGFRDGETTTTTTTRLVENGKRHDDAVTTSDDGVWRAVSAGASRPVVVVVVDEISESPKAGAALGRSQRRTRPRAYPTQSLPTCRRVCRRHAFRFSAGFYLFPFHPGFLPSYESRRSDDDLSGNVKIVRVKRFRVFRRTVWCRWSSVSNSVMTVIAMMSCQKESPSNQMTAFDRQSVLWPTLDSRIIRIKRNYSRERVRHNRLQNNFNVYTYTFSRHCRMSLLCVIRSANIFDTRIGRILYRFE